MATDLVSIIIPCYNAEPFLPATLDSAHRQTWPQIEIILVDDGSTDRSWEIAQDSKSSRLTTISQRHSGASAARNAALDVAKGKYIQFLDADDLLAPDKIAKQIALLSKVGPGFVASSAWGRFDRTPDDAVLQREAVWSDMDPVSWIVCSWERGGMMPLHGWLIPRAVVEAAERWKTDLTTNDDGEYMTRVILASDGVRFCPEAVCYYRSSVRKSLSDKFDKTAMHSIFTAIKMSSQHLLKKEDSVRVRRACAAAFQTFIFSAHPDYVDLVRLAEKEVQFFGGSDLSPGGGMAFSIISRAFGWKFARRLQVLRNRLVS